MHGQRMATKNTGSTGKGSQSNKPGARSQNAPTRRTSKKARKPVTIDLEPTKVVSKKSARPADDSAPKKTEPQTGKPTDKPNATSGVDAAKTVSAKPADKITSEKAKPAKTGSVPKSGKPTSSAPGSGIGKKPAPRADNYNKPGFVFGKAAAGFAGGAIALVGAYGLQQFGVIPSPGDANTELKAEISRIAESVKNIGEGQSAGSSAELSKELAARIAKIEASQNSIAANMEGQSKSIEEVAATASGLAARIEKVQETSARLEQSISSGSAGENAALTTLDERVKTLETGAGKAVEIETLSSQIEALNKQMAEISTANNAQASSDDVKALKTEIDSLSAKISEMAQNATNSQTAIESTIGKLQQSLKGIGSRVDQVVADAATPQKDEQRVARALAIAGLKSAIDAGGGFEGALTLVESLGVDEEALSPLKPFASIGVPTVSALQTSFAELSDKIITANAPAADKGVMNKLFANMRSLVKIKATGAIEGNTPLAIVSRIEDGLKKSDLEAVIKEWELLPKAAKALSGDWNKSLKARHQANRLIENLLNKFMTGTSGAGN